MNLMFETQKIDGLTYVTPAPKGHWLYRVRDAVAKLGRFLDRYLLG